MSQTIEKKESGGKREGSGRKQGQGTSKRISKETLAEVEKIDYPGNFDEKVRFAAYTMNQRKKMCITCRHQDKGNLNGPCFSCDDHRNYERLNYVKVD